MKKFSIDQTGVKLYKFTCYECLSHLMITLNKFWPIIMNYLNVSDSTKIT